VRKKKVRIIAIRVVLGAVVVGGLIFLLAQNCRWTAFRPTVFSSEEWLSGDHLTRGTMVEDLLDGGLLIDGSEEVILGMLGPPDKEWGQRWAYTVDIGQDICGSPWLYDMELFFNDDGHVERTELND
jgi:hypothetical protein